MFANSSSCSVPLISGGVVVTCPASFVAATHAVVEGCVVLMPVFFTSASFAIVTAVFSDTMRPAVSYVFAIDFALIGW